MNFLHTEIGSAKDNIKSPIHNWYKFTAGFSYKFVDEIITLEGLKTNSKSIIFEPFAGCGTTLVSAQKAGIKAVGNEAQAFMFDIIKGKLNWKLSKTTINIHLTEIQLYLTKRFNHFNVQEEAHSLLLSLYPEEELKVLYLIKDAINLITTSKYHFFFKLALSQTLHKVSNHPIAVPYISRNKILVNDVPALDVFLKIVVQMINDLTTFRKSNLTSKIFLQDSRFKNKNIPSGSCTTCITSPPYLNNLDYGEVSKVHTHFFGITQNWNDITTKVRKKLVTGSTTHYTESEYDLENYKLSEFYIRNKIVADLLLEKATTIKEISKKRAGKKSFDILMLFYFQDMFHVLKEVKRVLKKEGRAYLILGDSAPYGVLINTTKLLGEIAKSVGFSSYEIHKIRARGTKWKDLTYRHNVELSENVLVLK